MRELTPSELRWCCAPSEFPFRTTARVRPLKGIFGQDLAAQALVTGIQIRKHGYNVFVAGPTSSGRRAMIRECLRRALPPLPPPCDRVYVNHFAAPYRPRLLEFPPGRGADFVAALDALVNEVKKRVALLAQETSPRSAFVVLRDRFERRRSRVRDAFEKHAKQDGFVLGQVRTHEGVRPDLFFLHGQKPMALAELEELTIKGEFSEAQFSEIGRVYEHRMKDFGTAMAKLTQIDQEYAQEMARLERTRIDRAMQTWFTDMGRRFPQAGVAEHLRQLRGAMLDRLSLFRPRPNEPPENEDRDRFREFRGNLLTSGVTVKQPPVIFENMPTFSNLFGFVERPGGEDGGGMSDFLDIRPGSILEADRGFLVLTISDVLQSPALWTALKTMLRTGTLQIQEPEGPPNPAPALKPDPVPVDVKVILVGEPYVFDMLWDMDPEFRHNFKIRVDLQPDFPLTRRLLRDKVPACLARLCAQDHLLALDRQAVAAVVEHGVRMAGRRDKFTASLGKIADLLREADWCARAARARVIKVDHIHCAARQSIQRVNLSERRFNEAIINGTIKIQTHGKAVGQINGLAVYDVDDYTFGKPSRITVETAVGRAGIINIEREAGMSGGSHDKGVHILTGYLRARFAQNRPLSLTASICFEQSYAGIEGDSASSSEIYALLSSLALVPIRQDIAVTGSVNQKGEIQSIGNVNEKIEGFFDVVRSMRPTGREGVIIPESNVKDLMLRDDVVLAVRRGCFHIWAIETVEEGIEILTGLKAGVRNASGAWPRGSVFHRVDQHLEALARGLMKYEAHNGSTQP